MAEVVLDKKTKVPIEVVGGLIVILVPLTLWFGAIRSTANAAETDNLKQDKVIEVLQKDLSDLKADTREIKTLLLNKRSNGR